MQRGYTTNNMNIINKCIYEVNKMSHSHKRTGMTETSPRNTVSTSQRPSASTSVGIPPQGASAAADEFSASK